MLRDLGKEVKVFQYLCAFTSIFYIKTWNTDWFNSDILDKNIVSLCIRFNALLSITNTDC